MLVLRLPRASIDPNNLRSTNIYDDLGRNLAEINPLDYRTTTVFDAVGRRIALVDARGNRHSFTYDATGNQTQQIDPLDRRVTSGYDAASQQTLRIDARGNRTTYAFDANGQLTVRKYPDGSRATFAYDETGNRTLMANATGRYTYSYDGSGQTTVAANPNSKTITYAWDPVGNRAHMDAPDSGRFTYTYDAVNQITKLLNPFSEITTFGYDNSGRRTVQRQSNGTRTSLAYDNDGQTTQVFHRKSNGVSLLQLDYRYDNAGNRTVQIEGAGTARTTWSYDDANQLLNEHRTGTNSYQQAFVYDPAGNRTLKNADGTRTTFAYDNANQLQYAQAAAGRTTYVYDADGNQSIEQPPTGNRTTTTWDYENQPVQYVLPTGSPVTMTYNADNRRVTKQQSTSVTKFVWDADSDAYLAELSSANVVKGIYSVEPVPYGRVISQRRGANSRWRHADALGSTRLLTNSAQVSSDTYLYDAWGNTVSSTGSTFNPFRWIGGPGYFWDDETGAFYVRARMYMPTVARWTSVDPLPFHDSPNLYAYVQNAPLDRIDPSGLLDCYCNGLCEFPRSGIGFESTVNQIVNHELSLIMQRIFAVRSPELCKCPLPDDPDDSNSPAHQFRLAIRTLLGSDVPNPYARTDIFALPVTRIEQRLHKFTTTPGQIVPGPKKSYAGFQYDTADCMSITCGGKRRCIGSDKIGHFFQQGYMGYELGREGLGDWALGFFQLTEDLPISPTPGKQLKVDGSYMHFHEWKNFSRFRFFGFGNRRIRSWRGEWGPVQKSGADVAANMAGMRFYWNAPNLCECALWLAKGEAGPPPPDIKCFDICDYIDDSWVE